MIPDSQQGPIGRCHLHVEVTSTVSDSGVYKGIKNIRHKRECDVYTYKNEYGACQERPVIVIDCLLERDLSYSRE